MKPDSVVDFESLLELIKSESAKPGPKVSIYFSVTHDSRYVIEGKAELKALIQQAMRKITSMGETLETRLRIEASLESLLHNATFWEHRADGYVIFASSSVLHHFVPPLTSDLPAFASIASVGEEFDIRPLVPLLAYPEHFYAVEVGLGSVRMMRVHPELVVGVKLECPESFESFQKGNMAISDRNFHTTRLTRGGPNRGIVVPHGGNQDEKHKEVDRYAASIARAVDKLIGSGQDRAMGQLIVTGSRDLVRHFLRHLKHHHTIVSMDDLHLPEIGPASSKTSKSNSTAVREVKSLWQRCAKLYEESHAAREQQTALLAYRAFDGVGRTSRDLYEIEQLAETGQVSTLIVSDQDTRFSLDNASISGLLNKAIIATLRNHGDVIEAARHDWLNDIHTAAILRPGAIADSRNPFDAAKAYSSN